MSIQPKDSGKCIVYRIIIIIDGIEAGFFIGSGKQQAA